MKVYQSLGNWGPARRLSFGDGPQIYLDGVSWQGEALWQVIVAGQDFMNSFSKLPL